MRYARIHDGIVAEIVDVASDGAAPADLYHPDVVAAFVPVAADVQVDVGWAFDGATFTAPPPPAQPPAAIRAIRTYAFRQRLSVATRRAITLAASQHLDDGDAKLQTWLDDLASTGTTLLDDPDLIAGVGALHAAGLITAAERTALLADGTPEEV